jgi:multimeric flavodoxin WrbA
VNTEATEGFVMKLLGLSFGRKMGNTEVLIKEALMRAEKSGIELGFIRIPDLHIEPCSGCEACAHDLFGGGTGRCVIKDDFYFLDEHLMECDGVIIGSPVFVLTPTGLFKTVCDRLGPSHDMAFRMKATEIGVAKGKEKGQLPDERSFKRRIGGLISVGGSISPEWVSLGLPLLNLFTFPSHITVVDQMELIGANHYGNVVQNEKAMERARMLGRHVAEAMGKPADKAAWMGDEPGTCPVCHSNLLKVTSKNPVECALCGIHGEMKVNGRGITVTFSEEEQKRSRLTLAGEMEHINEIDSNIKIKQARMQREGKDLPGKLEKYRGYKEIQIKPSSA